MNALRQSAQQLSSVILAIVLGAVVMLCVATPDLIPGGAAVRIGVSGACLAGIALIVVKHAMGGGRHHTAARRYIDLLCRLEHHDLTDDVPLQAKPSLGKGNEWESTFSLVFETLKRYGDQIKSSEEARAVSEVRTRRLSAEQGRIAQILEGLSEPVLAIDSYDELVLANSSADELFGIGMDDDSTEKRVLAQVVECQELVRLLTETRRRKTLTPRSAEVQLTDEDGFERHYRILCRCIGMEEDADDVMSRHGAVAVLNDISNERAIQKRNAEFVSAVQSRNENATLRHQGVRRTARRWRRRRRRNTRRVPGCDRFASRSTTTADQ